jgi:hypothetical protein
MEMLLPGWAAEVSVTPIQKPVDPFSALSLHGALSVLLGREHESRGAASPPNFIVQGHAPYPAKKKHGGHSLPSVRVHFLHPDSEGLDGFDGPVLVWGAIRRVKIRFVGPVRVRSAPGTSHLHLQSETPLILRQTGHSREVREVRGEHLLSALRTAQRKYGGDDLPGRMSAHVAECRHIPFETRWSERVRGGVHWSATVEADETAAMWLLAGEVLGLGTYVSRGFGRYAVKIIGGGQ